MPDNVWWQMVGRWSREDSTDTLCTLGETVRMATDAGPEHHRDVAERQAVRWCEYYDAAYGRNAIINGHECFVDVRCADLGVDCMYAVRGENGEYSTVLLCTVSLPDAEESKAPDSDWQPIETAPTNTWCLVWDPRSNAIRKAQKAHCDTWRERGWKWKPEYSKDPIFPAFWQPLPPPPAKAEGTE